MYGTLEDQKKKFHAFITPQIIKDDASWASNVLDTQGLDGVTVLIRLGATDIAMAALRVETSDTISTATALGGTPTVLVNFATAPLALPTADDDNKAIAVYIPINGLVKRYINLVATAGNGSAGTYLIAEGICSPTIVPNTAAERGLLQQVILAAT
jgi:hypothetical protein